MGKQLIVILSNVIVSAISGFMGYYFSEKIESYKNKQGKLETTLSQFLIPLIKIMPNWKSATVQDIIVASDSIGNMMEKYELLVPQAHKNKFSYLLKLIKKYKDADDYLKNNFEMEIKRKYKNLYFLVDNYYNEIKRDLGYQYNSSYQLIKYSSCTPYSELFLLCCFMLFILSTYIVLLVINVIWALIFIAAYCIILSIVGHLYRKVEEKGGLGVVVRSILKHIFGQ